jgi:hypothetical protein
MPWAWKQVVVKKVKEAEKKKQQVDCKECYRREERTQKNQRYVM